MKKLILLLIISGGIASCGDNYISYSMYIDNQTNDTMKIIFSPSSVYSKINPDSLIFFPQHKKILYVAEGRAMNDGCDYTGIYKDEVNMEVYGNKNLKKEIWNVNNWDCEGNKKNGWIMTFVITESDLE